MAVVGLRDSQSQLRLEMRDSRPLVCAVALLAVLGSCAKKTAKDAGRVDLVVEAERVAASKSRAPEDIRPYDESLSWHEYKVLGVVSGELKQPVIRVAHWTVLRAKPLPVSTRKGERVRLKIAPYEGVEGMKGVNANDELDVVADEPPRFLDLSQPLPGRMKLADDRCDYGGNFSEQMKLYWKLRPQLKLVAMGNSVATKDICTAEFFDDENDPTPIALNLAPPGANMELQCEVIHDYVLPLPRLKWVVWVPTAREFNGRRGEMRKFKDFNASQGRAWDLAHQAELWPVPAAPLVALQDLEPLGVSGVDSWGWEGRRKTLLEEDEAAARRQIYKEMEKPDFAMSDTRWKMFCDMVRALNARGTGVLLLNPPLHPCLRDSPAADPDGTSHEGMREVVQRMDSLARDLPLTWFKDFNHEGRHDYEHGEFYDADHLNRSGSRHLTKLIWEWLLQCEGERS